jgi:ketopantoate reductase
VAGASGAWRGQLHLSRASAANAQIIVAAVKSGDNAGAADGIAEHATPGTLVVSFQNGVSNIDLLERTLHGRFDVARGMVPINGELVRLADRLQRTPPINRAIVYLVHKAELGANPLGPVELRRAALGR